MQTCVNCPWLIGKKNQQDTVCHRLPVERHLFMDRTKHTSLFEMFREAVDTPGELLKNDYADKVQEYLENQFARLSQKDIIEWAYCFSAHMTDETLHLPNKSKEQREKARRLLES